MKKEVIIRVFIFLFLLLLSFFVTKSIPSSIVGVLYTVAGIMFSVGIGLIVSFDLQGVRNKKFIRAIRLDLNRVRNKYIIYLCISTIVFVAFECIDPPILKFALYDNILSLNLSVIAGGALLYSIFYFIINFLSIQKLSNEVFDEVNK